MILFPSKYLWDIEQFHNFAECQQWNHSEDKQNKKLKTYRKWTGKVIKEPRDSLENNPNNDKNSQKW